MTTFLNKEAVYSGSLIIILFLLEYIYLRLARKHELFAVEKHSNSDFGQTVIGGGIIFPLTILIYSIYFGFPYPNYLIAAFILAFVSFIKDLNKLKYSYRIFSQIIALTLIIPNLEINKHGYFFILAMVVIGVGVLNSFNFIDRLNGMLGATSLIILSSILYLNLTLNFTDTNFIIAIIISIVVFLFFNFRKSPLCLAGDVGSTVIGYFIFIFIANLCFSTSDYYYLLLIIIPIAEAGLTLLFRILNNKKMLVPHKTYLFNLLTKHTKLTHLSISAIYASIQFIICFIVILTCTLEPMVKHILFISIITIVTVVYLYFRKKYFNISITIFDTENLE